MIEHRPFDTLGKANHGWLDANHHFSFAGYHDPERVNWGALRVWNDDIIAPKSGFPTHPHRDMEIITYVRTGAITHRDSMGNEGRTERVDTVGYRHGFREQRLAVIRQHRPARAFALEQGHSQLRFHLGNAVAYGRDRPAHLARRGAEAPLLGHCEKDAELVEARLAKLHYSNFLNILTHFIAVIEI